MAWCVAGLSRVDGRIALELLLIVTDAT